MSYNRSKAYYIEGEWGGRECVCCGWFRNWEEYNKSNHGFNGYMPKCRNCCKENYLNNKEQKLKYQLQYYNKNKEKITIRRKNFYQNNKEKITEKQNIYYIKNREIILDNAKQYYQKNKEKIAKRDKEYRKNNKEKIAKRDKEYRKNNKEKIAKRDKKYYNKNKEKIAKRDKKYYQEHKEELLEYAKQYREAFALYDTYADKLTREESARKTKEGYLEVKCANSNCREYFVPKNQQVQNRICSLNGQNAGENRIYCSEKCKHSCSLFKQIKYHKGFKANPTKNEFPAFVKEEIFKRDNYKCQICGETHRLQAHHIYPGSTHPMLSNDVDNGITLCKKCHKKVHKLPGCGLHEIAACSQRIKQDLDDKGIDPHEIPDWAVEKYMESDNNKGYVNV
jgi:5-methylcytosine-specific restriction endonuclease McrA